MLKVATTIQTRVKSFGQILAIPIQSVHTGIGSHLKEYGIEYFLMVQSFRSRQGDKVEPTDEEVMIARVTLNSTTDGVFELWVNEEGRNLLVKKLLELDEKNDHFHLASSEISDAEILLSTTPYRPSDKIVSIGKVLYRTDEWDKHYYPHVLDKKK